MEASRFIGKGAPESNAIETWLHKSVNLNGQDLANVFSDNSVNLSGSFDGSDLHIYSAEKLQLHFFRANYQLKFSNLIIQLKNSASLMLIKHKFVHLNMSSTQSLECYRTYLISLLKRMYFLDQCKWQKFLFYKKGDKNEREIYRSTSILLSFLKPSRK